MTELSIKISRMYRRCRTPFVAGRFHSRLPPDRHHLGCEHDAARLYGADGGEPVRSCITFAAVADGTEITTIEGFDEDEPTRNCARRFTKPCAAMRLLHAGDACRSPRYRQTADADEDRVRLELAETSGCTGYVGS